MAEMHPDCIPTPLELVRRTLPLGQQNISEAKMKISDGDATLNGVVISVSGQEDDLRHIVSAVIVITMSDDYTITATYSPSELYDDCKDMYNLLQQERKAKGEDIND